MEFTESSGNPRLGGFSAELLTESRIIILKPHPQLMIQSFIFMEHPQNGLCVIFSLLAVLWFGVSQSVTAADYQKCIASGASTKSYQIRLEGVGAVIVGNNLIFRGCNRSYHHFTMRRPFDALNPDDINRINFTNISPNLICSDGQSSIYTNLLLNTFRFKIVQNENGERLQLMDQVNQVWLEMTPTSARKLSIFRLRGRFTLHLPLAILDLNFAQNPPTYTVRDGGCTSISYEFGLGTDGSAQFTYNFGVTCGGGSFNYAASLSAIRNFTITDKRMCTIQFNRQYSQFQFLREPLVAIPIEQETQRPPINISGGYTFYFRRLEPLVVSLSPNRIEFQSCRRIYSEYSHPKWNRVRFEAFYTNDFIYCRDDVDGEYVAVFHLADKINNSISGVIEFQDEHGYALFSTAPLNLT